MVEPGGGSNVDLRNWRFPTRIEGLFVRSFLGDSDIEVLKI